MKSTLENHQENTKNIGRALAASSSIFLVFFLIFGIAFYCGTTSGLDFVVGSTVGFILGLFCFLGLISR